jgi:hypothetical protein
MSTEHPVEQAIRYITVSETETAIEEYTVGKNGVTRIEATTKSGMYADLPYVRVWKGDKAYAEFSQHNIVGVYFEVTP